MWASPSHRLTPGRQVIYILIALFALCACTSQPAQVQDRDQPPSRKLNQHHVSPGETLYSIAWRYDVDHRKLARYNDIAPPFTIYPGQVLQVDVGNMSAAKSASKAESTRRKKPQSRAKEATTPPADNQKASKRSKNTTPSKRESSPPSLVGGAPDWQWPVRGRVLSAFGASTGLNQGIDIAGKLGDSVEAAAAGHVVYAGSGLRGYGNLVIIKHNETYLSAYAHNHRLKVSEGDVVKVGQTIAEMGSSGTDKAKLHFEIRRDGKPVDPIGYLPKR